MSPSPFTMPCWWRLTGEPCNLWQAYKKGMCVKAKIRSLFVSFLGGLHGKHGFRGKRIKKIREIRV